MYIDGYILRSARKAVSMAEEGSLRIEEVIMAKIVPCKIFM